MTIHTPNLNITTGKTPCTGCGQEHPCPTVRKIWKVPDELDQQQARDWLARILDGEEPEPPIGKE